MNLRNTFENNVIDANRSPVFSRHNAKQMIDRDHDFFQNLLSQLCEIVQSSSFTSI